MVKPTRRRPLAQELAGGYRLIVAAATLMVVAVIGMLTYTLVGSDPARESAERVMTATNRVAGDFLEVRSDARLFVLTGEPGYRQKYAADRARLDHDLQTLRAERAPSLAPAIGRASAAVDAWFAGYGDRYTVPSARDQLLAGHGEFNRRRFTAASLTGNQLADEVQKSTAHVTSTAHDLESQADRHDHLTLIVGGGLLVVIGMASALIAAARSRRLVASFGHPIARLLSNVQSVARGDFAIEVADSDVTEVAELAGGIADMATSLRLQRKALSLRAEQSQRLAERLRRVLGFAREISASLTVPTVVASITKAACLLGGTTQARVWLFDDDGELSVAHDSQLDLDASRPSPRRPAELGVVGKAAQSATVTCGNADTGEAGRCALPLVSNGRTIGVLEVTLPGHRRAAVEEILEVLEVIAGQGATAIEAARLYQHTELLSLSDPLTGLGNRRRLDHDLALEVDRAVRYGRPMTLLLLDVDHFKTVNDGFGHAQGDLVLQGIAATLCEHLRTVDSAYRYGGEELALLARETDRAGGEALADRVREAVEQAFAGTPTPVTVSIGVAAAPGHGGTPDALVRAADQALYAAKRAGRNRVTTAMAAFDDGTAGRVPSQS